MCIKSTFCLTQGKFRKVPEGSGNFVLGLAGFMLGSGNFVLGLVVSGMFVLGFGEFQKVLAVSGKLYHERRILEEVPK